MTNNLIWLYTLVPWSAIFAITMRTMTQNGKMVMMMMTHMLVPCVGNVGHVESTYCHLGEIFLIISERLNSLNDIRSISATGGHLVDKIPSSRLIPCVREYQIIQIIQLIWSSMVCWTAPYLWTTVDGTALESGRIRVNHKLRWDPCWWGRLSTCYLGVFEQEWLWPWPPQLHHPADTMLINSCTVELNKWPSL